MPVTPTYLKKLNQDLKREEKFTARKSNNYSYGETLDFLDNDEEYIKRSERFLKSINEGETVDDLYEYFRDADWNLARGAYRAFKELPNLNQEQKDDYRYLKNRFDNADMGGMSQYLKAAGDIGIDMLSDPTLILSTLFAPVTGGASFGARAALGKTAQLGLKRVGKSFVQDVPLSQAMKKMNLFNVRGGTRKAKKPVCSTYSHSLSALYVRRRFRRPALHRFLTVERLVL